jgi:L-iditol 2-dehydrogenase
VVGAPGPGHRGEDGSRQDDQHDGDDVMAELRHASMVACHPKPALCARSSARKFGAPARETAYWRSMEAMRVARLHGARDLRLSDEPRPGARPGECLVRVEAVGVCGSDLHWYEDGGIGDSRLVDPLVIGHEFAGVVEDGPLTGRRVAVDPAIPCGRCELCREGHPNLCPNVVFAGHGSSDGGLRQYLSWPTDRLHALPDALDGVAGALLEPLGVAIHALDLGHVAVGARVAIVGCGPIGLLLGQVATAAGASVVLAVDPLEHRRAAAARAGAEAAIAPEAIDAWEGPEVDMAFEAAGTDAAVDLALRAARPGARVVLVGIPSGDQTTFSASIARRKGITLVLVRRMKEVYPRALRLVESGAVDVQSLVTHRFPLERVGDAFEVAAARDGLKVMVEP